MCGQRYTQDVFLPWKTRHPLTRTLAGSHSRSRRVRKISPAPGFDTPTAQPITSRCADWVTPARVSGHHIAYTIVQSLPRSDILCSSFKANSKIYFTGLPRLKFLSPRCNCKKVQQSRNRPGVAQRVPGGLGSQISWHSAREVCEVVSLTHRPPLPQGMFLVLIFTGGWVDPRAMVRSEGNMSLKNPVTKPGIDHGTVRIVARCLNHYATPGHRCNCRTHNELLNTSRGTLYVI